MSPSIQASLCPILSICILCNIPTEIFLSRHRSVIWSSLSSLVFNAPTIFHGTCTALAWVAVSGRYSSEKRTWKMPEYRDNAFSRIWHWIQVSQTDTEPRRRISPVFPCETLTENSRATILPAKGYNKYGAIVTITLLYQMQATRTGSRRRYYCDVGVSQCWLLLSRFVTSWCEVRACIFCIVSTNVV